MCVLSNFSHVQLFATLWTIVRQAPLSMGFSTPLHGVGCHALLQGNLPNPGIEPRDLLWPLHYGWILYHWAAWWNGVYAGKQQETSLARQNSIHFVYTQGQTLPLIIMMSPIPQAVPSPPWLAGWNNVSKDHQRVNRYRSEASLWSRDHTETTA